MTFNYLKLSILSFIIMLLSMTSNAQNQLVIGTGTYTNYNIPVLTYYNYGWSQSIYLASELGTSKNITKLAYKVSSFGSGSSVTVTNQKIYIQETTASNISSSSYADPSSNGATLVYNGTVTYVNGWVEITLQTPFNYSGNSNLMISYENRHGTGNSSYPYFECSYYSNYMSSYNAGSPVSVFTYSGSYIQYRPNIRLTYSTSANDLALYEWMFPQNGSTTSSTMPVMLKVKNVGTAAQSGYTVKYSIDNGQNWKSQVVSGSLGVGNTSTVSFNTIANMADMGTAKNYQCIAVVKNTGDTITSNDTLRTNIAICNGGYSGTYTIGNDTASDFPSVEAAVAAIENCGINGPVTFKIKTGIYQEQFRVGAISGLSSSTPITFTSYTGNFNDVVFKYQANNLADNYVLRLDTASYITIKNITFKALGGAYSTVASLEKTTQCTLNGNKFISSESSSVSSNQCVIGILNSGSSFNSNLEIKNNILLNGSYGIYSNSSGTTQNTILEISNNDISNFGAYGIYFYYANNFKINANKLHAPFSASAVGIYLTNCTLVNEVMQNKVNLESGTCFYSYYSDGTGSQPSKVANNFFTQSTQTSNTVYLYYSDYINFDFNSIHTQGSSTSYSGLYVYYGSNLIARNNNIINNAGGRALYNSTTNNFYSMDYNNYYTSGSYIASWGGSSKTTLSALQSASYMDTHSMSNNITFYSNENLHVSGSSLNSAGTPVSGITVDIDGQTRNTTTPDIGADEYEIYANDAGLLTFANINGQCPGSAVNISLTLKNFGSSALTAANIGWSVNGHNQTALSWTGLLGALNTTNSVVGSYNFSADTTYELKAWINTANAVADPNPYNDSIVTSNYHTSLSAGSYLIGSSSSAQFSDIQSAIDVLNNFGICGPVVFNIESGTYSGQYNLGTISGQGSTNTITFQSLSGSAADVILTSDGNSTNNHVFKLQNNKHTKFKNLTLHNSNTIYCIAISASNSNHITIDHCIFNSTNVNGQSSEQFLIKITQSSQITVSNSVFNGANGIYNYGTSSSTFNTAVQILNNTISDIVMYGIYNSYAGDSTNIIGNTITNGSTTYSPNGIYNYYCTGPSIIAKNKIIFNNYNSYGIFLYYQNYYNSSASEKTDIYNNYIGFTNGNNTANGVRFYQSDYINFSYNTIKIRNTSTANYGAYLYYSSNVTFKNNNIDVANSNYVLYNYYSLTAASNYNNFYSTAANPFYQNGSSYTFANYKYYSGFDANSKTVNPTYISSGDFHLYDTQLNNAGSPVSGITTDIDGETRHTSTPDIGADEYTMAANDVALYAINQPNAITNIGTNNIKLAIRNMGTSTLYLAGLHYQIDNGTIINSNWSGYLTPLSIDSFILVGSASITSGNHTIKAWTTAPNNVTDQNKLNDTLVKTFSAQVMPSIELHPTSLLGTINGCNDSVSVPLKIKNLGGATLTGTINGATSAGGSNSLQVVMLTYGVSSTYTTNLTNALDATFSNYTLTYSSAYTATQLQTDLAGKDVVIMPYMGSSSYLSTYQTFTSTLQNFVSNGGSMIFSGLYSSYFAYATNTGLWNNTSYAGYNSYSNLTVANHQITNGITASMLSNVSDNFFYFNGTPSNYTSLLSYGGYQVAGMSSYGDGYVFYLGFGYYAANQTPIETLISNTLGYISDQNVNWLHNSVTSFSITPGDSTFINYVMSGVGKNGGTYTSTIEINSNDYGNPTIIVPCTMTVVGTPTISANNSISFGSVYTNVAKYDTLELINTGCGNLNISNITTSNTAFSAPTTSFTVAPGDTAFVVYKFQTATAGSYVATSTIFSNTSNFTVSLAGNAASAPHLIVSPNPISITIPNCNDSVTVSLNLQNTGGTTLNATVENTKDTVEIIMLTYNAVASYLANLKSAMSYTFSKYNYVETTTLSATTLQNLITARDADVIIIPSSNSSSSFSVYASVLQSFANAGGTVIIVGAFSGSMFSATGLISGTRHNYVNYATFTTQNTSDLITYGFPSSFAVNSDYYNYYTFTGTGITSLVKYGTYDVAVRKVYGSGHVIVLGNYYYYSNESAQSQSLISNSIKYASEQGGADWVHFSTSSHNIAANGSYIKPIVLNSTGLSTGQHLAQIKISSNDPVNPIIYVPCTLNVQNQMANGVNLGNDTTHCGATTLNAGSYSTYLWNTSNTTQTITAVSSGTYSVTVSNGGNCTSTDAIVVTINPIPSINISTMPSTACANGNSINLTATPTGGVYAGTGIVGNSFNPGTAGVGAHTLYYSYTNAYNCTANASKLVNVYAPPAVSFTGLAASYCPSGTASVLTGTPSGGVFSGSGIVGNIFAPSIAGVGNHNIVYSYTDSYNCNNKDTNATTVTAPAINIAISGYQSSYCINGASSTLVGSPSGGTFSGHGVTGSTFNPGLAGLGTHYIRYAKTDPNGCLIKDSVAVTVHALPSGLSISGLVTSYCANDPAATLVGYPAGGVFSGPGMTVSTFNPITAGSGTHNIVYTYTNVYNCSNSTSIQTDVDPIPVISFTNLQSQYCLNDNAVSLAALPVGGTFSGNEVSSGQFDPSFAGIGSYKIYYQYTNTATTCTNIDSFAVSVVGLPTVAMGTLASSFCSNAASTNLSASPIGGTFSGSGVSGSTFSPSTAGVGSHTIHYSFTDNNNCTNTDSASTNVIQVHGVSAGADAFVTYNTATQLAGIVSGGSGSFAINWTPSNMLINASQLSPFTVNLTNTTLFTLTVTDNGTSCVNSDQVLVTIQGGTLSASATANPNTICAGQSTQLQALGTGGLGNYTYSWSSTPSGFSSTISYPLVSPTANTTYTCIINDGANNSTAQVSITVNPSPTAVISNLASSYCNNNSLVNVNLSPIGGTLSGSGIVGNTFVPSVASIGQNMITYSVTNSYNCTNIDTVIVQIYSAPIAYAGEDRLVPCLNGGVSLGQQAVNGINYQWTPAIGLSSSTIANPIANPNMSINYALQATNPTNGCTAVDTVNITVIGGPTAHASRDTVVCANTPVVLTASGGDTYFWSNGSIGDTITVTPATSTLYYVIVSQSGCADLDTVFVNISQPTPDLGPDSTICGGSQITLNAGAGYTNYQWSLGGNSQTIVIDSTGIGLNTVTVVVQVTDTIGCLGVDIMDLTFVDCTSLNDLDDKLFAISVYPNPSKGQFIIESVATTISSLDLQVVDGNGRLIVSKTIHNQSGYFKEKIDLSTQPKGPYFVKIGNQSGQKVFSVLLQ